MEKKNLKDMLNRLRSIIDELESEIYSDPTAYIKSTASSQSTFGFYNSDDDDDGWTD
jgi:hypothetical protein